MKARMTPPERMHAVMTGQTPDRVPVIPFIGGYAAKIVGISIGDYYSDGGECFEAQFACMRLHGYEATPGYAYASAGPWEFGGKIELPYKEGTGAPYVTEHLVYNIEDIETLEVPSFKDSLPGGYAEADKVAKRCRELGMPVAFQCGSSFTAASVIADTSTFLKWTRKEPKAAHQLLKKANDMFCNAIDYFASEYGAENCVPFFGGASEAKTVISPKIFEEFAYPYMLEILKKIKEQGFPAVMMHPCADQNENIPYYVRMREELGWAGKCAWLFGPETPLSNIVEAFGNHDVICGNVDPTAFQAKSYEEVLQLCKENIEAGKDSPSGFILSPGCEMPPFAPPVNVMAMMDAAEMYGKYE